MSNYRRNLENKRKKTELEEINSESFLSNYLKHINPQGLLNPSESQARQILKIHTQIYCNKAAEPHRKRVNLITERKK